MVRVETDAFAETIRHYLEHEAERKHMAEAGRRHVTDNLAWAPIVLALLRHSRECYEDRCGVIV